MSCHCTCKKPKRRPYGVSGNTFCCHDSYWGMDRAKINSKRIRQKAKEAIRKELLAG